MEGERERGATEETREGLSCRACGSLERPVAFILREMSQGRVLTEEGHDLPCCKGAQVNDGPSRTGWYGGAPIGCAAEIEPSDGSSLGQRVSNGSEK